MKLKVIITEDTEGATITTSLEGPNCQCGHDPNNHMSTVELEFEHVKEPTVNFVLYGCLYLRCSCIEYTEVL